MVNKHLNLTIYYVIFFIGILFLTTVNVSADNFNYKLAFVNETINADDSDLILQTLLFDNPTSYDIDWRVNDNSIAVINMAIGDFYFNGKDTGVKAENNIDNLSSYTLMAWIKPENVAGFKNIFYFPETNGYFAIAKGICSWTGIWSCIKNAPAVNKWTHIAITSNGNVYQNGVYDGKIKVKHIAGKLIIGDRDDTKWDFKGFIEEVKVFNRALSPEQINAFYQNKNLMVHQETKLGEKWQAYVITGVTNKYPTNPLLINNPPTQNKPLLVSSTNPATNKADLTIINQSTFDLNNDKIKNIIDWRVNEKSISVLNLHLEAHTESAVLAKDYSTNQNNAVVALAEFKQNGGYDGKGAYYFAGDNNARIATTQLINLSEYTVSLWIKPESAAGFKNLMYIPESKHYFSINNGICSWTGTVWSCTKKAPLLNTWTNVVITSDGNVYQNGVYDGKIKVLPLTGTVTLGDRDQTAYDFKGYLDEIKIYNRILSQQQIETNFQRNDLIVSHELTTGETWNAAVTPNDGFIDGETKVSNEMEIKDASSCEQRQWVRLEKYIDPFPEGIFGVSDKNIYVYGFGVVMDKYDGNSWNPIQIDKSFLGENTIMDMWGSSEDNIFAVGSTQIKNSNGDWNTIGAIFHYDGNNWTTILNKQSLQLNAIWANSASDIYVVGDNNTILHYDGEKWTSINDYYYYGGYYNVDYFDIWGSSKDDIYIAGFDKGSNFVMHYDGFNWDFVMFTGNPFINHLPNKGTTNKIFGTSTNNVYISDDKTIYHFDGNNWVPFRSFSNPITDLWGISDDNFYVLSNLSIYHYNGKSWKITKIKDTGMSTELKSIAGLPSGDLFVVGIIGDLFLQYGCNASFAGNVIDYDIVDEEFEYETQNSDLGDHILGDNNANITMIEFANLQDYFSGKFYNETFSLIKEEYIDTGKVKFIFKHFPLSFHENSQKAAEASECAGEQGAEKFWLMHDKMLENQQALSVTDLKKYAAELNLNVSIFNECLDSGKYTQAVLKDFLDGQNMGVDGIPTFFINRMEFGGAQPYENFKKVFEQILAGETPTGDQPEPSADSELADSSNDPEIVLTIVNDKNCKACVTTSVSNINQQAFKTVKEKVVDINSNEGKELIKKYEIKVLPFYIYDSKIKEAVNYDKIAYALIEKDETYYISPEAGFAIKLLELPDMTVDHVKGTADAKVTMIEWSDFQCPFCGKFYADTLKQIEKDYIDTGNVKFIFKHFPLSFHENSQKAAEASECAGEQGSEKFWLMHDKMLENQQALTVVDLKKYAADLKLDPMKFDECLDTNKYAEKVKADMDAGAKVGIQGTPGFLINGIIVSGAQPFAVFEEVIKAELGE